MSRKKTVKRTSAPRTARKPEQPIDPRLQRVLDAIDENWSEDRDFDGLAHELLNAVLDRIPSPEGLKASLVAMVQHQVAGALDLDVALNALAKLADEEHRAHCACCAARHAEVVE